MKMKKLLAMLMLLVFAVTSLTACGSSETSEAEAVEEESAAEESSEAEEAEEVKEEAEEEADPYEGLTLYESETGISVYMAEGYEETSAEGLVCYYEGDLACVGFAEETFESLQPVLEEAGFDSLMNSNDYGELLYEVYQIEGSELLTNEYGELYMTYELMIEGMSVTYFVYFDQGTTSWWATNFICPTEVAADMEADFHLWATSVQVP